LNIDSIRLKMGFGKVQSPFLYCLHYYSTLW